MGKRKKHEEEHENLERWLVSYADFITLLFATFVVLYALSQIDLAKFKDLKTSIREAFNNSPTVLKGDPGIMNERGNNLLDSKGFKSTNNIIPSIFETIASEEEKKHYKILQDELKLKKIDEIKGVKTEITERGLVIKMLGNLFFDSSTSQLKKDSLKTLNEIGLLLKEKFPFHLIRVEGHTDNQPINSSKFPSNWELSAYRAASVVRYLTENMGMKKNRFVTIGYADSRPVASNETQKGRNANRRVEIVVLRSKLIQAELKTHEFEKKRLERLEKIRKAALKNKKGDESVSEAAKKLIDYTKKRAKSIILYEDKYKEESEELEENLEKYEKETDPHVKKRLFFDSVRKELQHIRKN